MPRKAIIDKQTGMVLNVIIADDDFAENLPVDVELVDAPYHSGLEIGNIVDLNQTVQIVVDTNSDEKVADVIKNIPNSKPPAHGKVNNANNIKVIQHPKVINDFTQSDYETYLRQTQIAIQKLNSIMVKPPRKFVRNTFNESDQINESSESNESNKSNESTESNDSPESNESTESNDSSTSNKLTESPESV